MPILLAGLHYHAPPAPSTTARACLNALTAHGKVRVGFARRWCVVGVQHVSAGNLATRGSTDGIMYLTERASYNASSSRFDRAPLSHKRPCASTCSQSTQSSTRCRTMGVVKSRRVSRLSLRRAATCVCWAGTCSAARALLTHNGRAYGAADFKARTKGPQLSARACSRSSSSMSWPSRVFSLSSLLMISMRQLLPSASVLL